MKLIIFDFDGVLVDTLIMTYEITKEINPEMSLEDFRLLNNGNFLHSIENSLTIKNHPEFFERYKEESRELKIPPSLKDLIYKLSKECTLAIVSSSLSSLIKDILDREDAMPYFMDILGSDLHKSKVFKNKMLLEKYKVDPKDAVFITDTVGDILEARECGIKSIAVTWGFQDAESLQKAKPAKIVSMPEDLMQAITELTNA
ncbi:MAG: HAD-IA family hydrolase [Patescibacteria group bacterium]